MRELNFNEVKQVSGGLTGPGEIFGPEEFGAASRFAGSLTLLYGSARAGWGAGTYINNNCLSYETKDAIGHTTHKMVTRPVESIRTAIDFWF